MHCVGVAAHANANNALPHRHGASMWLLILFSVYSRPQGTAECLLYGCSTHRHPHGGPTHTHHLHRGHCECKCDAWHCEVHSAHDSSRYDLVYDGAITHNSLPHHDIALGVASLLRQCSADDALRGSGSTMSCQREQCFAPSPWRLHVTSHLIQCDLQAPGHCKMSPLWL